MEIKTYHDIYVYVILYKRSFINEKHTAYDEQVRNDICRGNYTD